MKVGLAPSKNAAHRLACLSVYKALLQRCSQLALAVHHNSPISRLHSDTLATLVRYRFGVDKRYVNWWQAQAALRFGREALQLLEDATGGSSAALQRIAQVVTASRTIAVHRCRFLGQLQDERAQRHLPRKFIERKAGEAFLADKTNYRRRPDTVPVLQRPVPYEQALKDKHGRRRVPKYFVAQGLPFLRYTSRQPLSLSRYMSQQFSEHEKLWKQHTEGQEMIAIAGMEDDWDMQLWKDHQLASGDAVQNQENGNKWADAWQAAWTDNQAKSNRSDAKRLEYGQRLWNIFLKEEQLAKAENKSRKEQRKKLREERRATEDG